MTDNGKSQALTHRQTFGGSELEQRAETAAAAVAAQAKAAVEARWIVAMKQPRIMDQVRADVLRECKRPSFADVARYHKPVGQGVTGPSIRYVEAALQAMGNILTATEVIYDDDNKRILAVSVTDLEKNVTHPKQITVTKLVERSSLRKGQTAVGRRTNSKGNTVYIVQASDDDLLNKEAALVSKALRTCGLRLIPGWLTEEAMALCVRTQNDRNAKDPDAERKALADAFGALSVTPEDLVDYLGHSLDKCSPAELGKLRAVYAAIREGEATWADSMDAKREERGEAAPAPEPKAPGKGTGAVKAAVKGRKSKTKAKPAPKPEPPKEPDPEPGRVILLCEQCNKTPVDGPGEICGNCEPAWMTDGAPPPEPPDGEAF